MSVKVNPEAVKHARQLIEDDQYSVNTQWSQSQPSTQEENSFLDKNGDTEYAKWYLAIDTDESEDSKERHKFPYGDFRRLHRSGVIAAKQRAAQNDYKDVEDAADDLLDLLDRLDAC